MLKISIIALKVIQLQKVIKFYGVSVFSGLWINGSWITDHIKFYFRLNL